MQSKEDNIIDPNEGKEGSSRPGLKKIIAVLDLCYNKLSTNTCMKKYLEIIIFQNYIQ